MERYVTDDSKLIRRHLGATDIGSVRSHTCTAPVVYHFIFRKTACQKYYFQILSQKNAQIVNLKNPDLDLIRRM